jgi:hypothetical protein
MSAQVAEAVSNTKRAARGVSVSGESDMRVEDELSSPDASHARVSCHWHRIAI